jgi:hypothetical protein
MTTIYACYISGNYQHFTMSEGIARQWAKDNGEFHSGFWLQGAYEPLVVSTATARRLIWYQPCLSHTEALTFA